MNLLISPISPTWLSSSPTSATTMAVRPIHHHPRYTPNPPKHRWPDWGGIFFGTTNQIIIGSISLSISKKRPHHIPTLHGKINKISFCLTEAIVTNQTNRTVSIHLSFGWILPFYLFGCYFVYFVLLRMKFPKSCRFRQYHRHWTRNCGIKSQGFGEPPIFSPILRNLPSGYST